MSLRKDPDGRRFVQVEVEVPGTPEQVWQAIATGPGISAWFVPTEFRDDGTVVSDFGPGMESVARVTAWEPPNRFEAVSDSDMGPGAPPIATEWIVEAQSGGYCIVRVVHSLFTSSEEWDNQLESFESGWPWFFQILRLYLNHFPGQPCSPFRLMGVASGAPSEVWDSMTAKLGLSSAGLGDRRSAPDTVPSLAGVIEKTGEWGHSYGCIIRLEAPAPGLVSMFVLPMGGQVYPVVDFLFYGDTAAEVVSSVKPQWQAWMKDQYPMPQTASESGAQAE